MHPLGHRWIQPSLRTGKILESFEAGKEIGGGDGGKAGTETLHRVFSEASVGKPWQHLVEIYAHLPQILLCFFLLYSLKDTFLFIHSTNVLCVPPVCFLLVIERSGSVHLPVLNTCFALVSVVRFHPRRQA